MESLGQEQRVELWGGGAELQISAVDCSELGMKTPQTQAPAGGIWSPKGTREGEH